MRMFIPEFMVDWMVPRLIAWGAYSIPTDVCECLYLWNFVFEVFA